MRNRFLQNGRQPGSFSGSATTYVQLCRLVCPGRPTVTGSVPMTVWEERANGPEFLHSPVRDGSGGTPGVSRHPPPFCIGVVTLIQIFLGWSGLCQGVVPPWLPSPPQFSALPGTWLR